MQCKCQIIYNWEKSASFEEKQILGLEKKNKQKIKFTLAGLVDRAKKIGKQSKLKA
jgi:hypothetical protein